MTDTANLKDGFYWVRYGGGEWVRAKKKAICGGFVWEVDEEIYPSGLFDEIDPRPIEREELT